MRTTEVERALLWTAGQVRGELLAEVKDFGRLKHLIEQLERFEVIEAYPQLGDVSDHIRESPVLDCCWIMPSVPHMDWAGDALVSYVVPGPSEWEADKERAKLEAEVTQELPAAVAAAKARLQAYRVAYVALVEARMAHIVEFCLGRFDSADRGHGISRKRRPEERQAAMLQAHEVAAQYGESVRKALLGISLEALCRDVEFWQEMSYEKVTRAVFSDASHSLTVAIVQWLEDAGLESRPLVGVADHTGSPEANQIMNAARWERDANNALLPSAPMVELRALKAAASNVRQGDFRLAGAA